MKTRQRLPLHRKLPVLGRALVVVAVAVAGAATAGPSVAGSSAAGTEAAAPELQRWVEQSATASWAGQLGGHADGNSGVRFEVTLGQLNPGLRLAPCARIEPFLPPNARLWGRSFVGVRCVEGARWTTMLPVTVSVYGMALVANLPVAIGALANPADFRIEEVDLTRSRGQPVADPALLEGRAIGRPLSAGQILRIADLRTPQTVSAGDPVRIRLLGRGFTITTEGFAMAGAGDGQSLRVRTQTGKMLVGTVRDRSVEVRL